jgi:tRNA (guanine37-N1)-methyltransferase
MRVDLVTIFPDYFAPLSLSLIGKARAAGVLDVRVHDLRDWTDDPHRTVDDSPYGGGAGMVMRPEPWGRALDAVAGAPGPEGAGPLLIVPTPAGTPLTQALAARLAQRRWLVLACGRYEGIDARVLDEASSRWPLVELSIGDYVLAGGEAAALVIVEAVTRLLPGVVGNAASVDEDSYALPGGLLEYPVYTRPPVWRSRPVPPALLSGNHRAIARWRREQAVARTARRRPDLLRGRAAAELDRADLAVLTGLGWTVGGDGTLHPPGQGASPGTRCPPAGAADGGHQR